MLCALLCSYCNSVMQWLHESEWFIENVCMCVCVGRRGGNCLTKPGLDSCLKLFDGVSYLGA